MQAAMNLMRLSFTETHARARANTHTHSGPSSFSLKSPESINSKVCRSDCKRGAVRTPICVSANRCLFGFVVVCFFEMFLFFLVHLPSGSTAHTETSPDLLLR